MDVVVVVTKGERELVDASYSEGKKVEKWVSLAWRHRVRGRFRCAGCAVDRAGATAVHTFWARGPVFFFFFSCLCRETAWGGFWPAVEVSQSIVIVVLFCFIPPVHR